SLLTRLHENTGQALGFHLSGGDSAGLVAPVIAAIIGVQFGWRVAMLAGLAVVVPVVIVCSRRIRPMEPARPDISIRERADPKTLLALLLTPSIAYTTLLAIVLAFTFQAVIAFYPTFLIEARGFSTADASLLYSGIFAIWIPLLPLMGRFADRLTHDSVLGGMMVSLAVGLGIATGVPTRVGAMVSVVFLGLGMAFGGVLAARFMSILSPDQRTEGYGLVRAVYMLIGSTGSVITGVIADLAGWTVAYGSVGALVLVVFGTVVVNRVFGLGL
ncbi:MAG: MFS transporter, partial [Halobacteriales archaeon]|nr:MFS transporter [Halobacteriales archaeon]